jgi:hypothetical protein
MSDAHRPLSDRAPARRRRRAEGATRSAWPRARVAVIALALIVAACGSLALRNPPRLEIVAVQLDRVQGADAYFGIDVLLTNQGSDELVIDALQGTLSLEDEKIAEATLVTAPVRIPANGSAPAQLVARPGMDAVLRAVTAAMRRGATIVAPGAHPVLHYTLDGTAKFAGGARMPFRRSGELGERSK